MVYRVTLSPSRRESPNPNVAARTPVDSWAPYGNIVAMHDKRLQEVPHVNITVCSGYNFIFIESLFA